MRGGDQNAPRMGIDGERQQMERRDRQQAPARGANRVEDVARAVIEQQCDEGRDAEREADEDDDTQPDP